jgi:hypothetical protein
VDLTEWTKALFREVVEAGRPGVGLYFYVDREVLAAAAGSSDADAAFADLCAAYVRESPRHRPFGRQAQAADRWRAIGARTVPPFLTALAMSVLAVTEEPLGAAHGVYRRQNQLLGLPAEPVEPPGYGEDVPHLWTVWNWWLAGPGNRYGRPTARTHEHWSRQGWARSQALVRHADRELMQHWFDREGLQPGDTVVPVRLLELFRAWLTYRGSVGQRLSLVLGDRAAAAVLADVLAGELRSWDGTVRDRGGQRSVHGLVTWDAWTGRFSAALRVTADLAGVEVDDGHGLRTLDEHDDLVPVQVGDDAATLLGNGSSVRLAPALVLRVGGDPVYLLADDDTMAALVQQPTPQVGFSYRALVRDDVLTRALAAFAAAGAGPLDPRPGPCAGWTVLDPVQMTRSVEDPELAGIGRVTPREPTRLELHGGLGVGPLTFLTTGPPDLVVPPGPQPRPVVVDGRVATSLVAGACLVSLRQLLTVCGRHEVGVGEHHAAVRLTDHVHEQPVVSGYGHLVELDRGTPRLGAFVAQAPTARVVRGALVRAGGPGEAVVLARTLGSAETFVLTEAGRCVAVDVRPPGWLAELGLDAGCVDVLSAARGLAGTPAFFLYRHGPTRPLRLVEIIGQPIGRRSREVAERPDVAADLFSQIVAGSVPAAAGARRRRLTDAVQAAVRRGTGRGAVLSRPTHPTVPAPRPAGRPVRSGGCESVPGRHDQLLGWLCEQEGGTASTRRFAETWGWLCHRDGRPHEADRAALVAYHLEVLGHLEQDRAGRRVGGAPAVVSVLTDGGGYGLLCGARPTRLLERLEAPDRDPDPRVCRAGPYWDVHRRAQRDETGEPVGPAAVYLEWDPGHHREVLDGLEALGVQVVARAADRLLDLLVPLPRTLATAPELSMSPSARFERWQPAGASGRGCWPPTTSDRAPGLYRYPSWGGPVFAWRAEPAAALRVVDKRVGFYLQHAWDGRRDLFHHDPFRSSLLVPRAAPLPPLAARALVLRTGLLPRLLSGFRPDGIGAGRDVLVYCNVDLPTAERVAELHGQTVDQLGRRLEECR